MGSGEVAMRYLGEGEDAREIKYRTEGGGEGEGDDGAAERKGKGGAVDGMEVG